MKRLLLISNSTQHGGGYLDHCEDEIKSCLGDAENIVFVPYARPGGISHDEYAKKAAEKYSQMGYNLKSIHEENDPEPAISNADAIFIGGGNSFVLLNKLHETRLIEYVKVAVEAGVPYIGTSAGTNVTCPTIMTTNDMPIREVVNFRALNLFPYQINPHYLDPDPNSKHQGETRETRIKEYLAFNDKPVIGLREGGIIRVEGDGMKLKGNRGARIFKKNQEPYELEPGNDLNI